MYLGLIVNLWFECQGYPAREIGLQASRVAKLEWDITKAILTSPMYLAHKMHLRLCLESIVEVSDRAEDAGDQLEPATLKSMV